MRCPLNFAVKSGDGIIWLKQNADNPRNMHIIQLC